MDPKASSGVTTNQDVELHMEEESTQRQIYMSLRVSLQNRINPKKRETCQRSDYWLIPVDTEASAEEEKEIVESSIQPYGILIKQLNDDDDDDDDSIDNGNDDNSANVTCGVLHSFCSAFQSLFK